MEKASFIKQGKGFMNSPLVKSNPKIQEAMAKMKRLAKEKKFRSNVSDATKNQAAKNKQAKADQMARIAKMKEQKLKQRK